jgi:hypothetical protein
VARGSRSNKIAQGLGQKSHRRARRGKTESLDRRARSLGFGGHVDGQRTHRVAGQGQDLARGSVGDAQGLDRHVRKPQVPKHRAPVAETVVEEESLGRVARQGDGGNLAGIVPAGRGSPDERGQLHGRQILRLVHEQVAKWRLRFAQQLIGAQENGQIVDVQNRQIVLGALAIDADLAAHVLVVVDLVALGLHAPHVLGQIVVHGFPLRPVAFAKRGPGPDVLQLLLARPLGRAALRWRRLLSSSGGSSRGSRLTMAPTRVTKMRWASSMSAWDTRISGSSRMSDISSLWIGQQIRPQLDDSALAPLGLGRSRAPLQLVQQGRMALHPGHRGNDLVGDGGAQPGDGPLQFLSAHS